MQLVEIKKLDLVTNSAVIATGVKKDHKPVIQLIRKYKSDLEEFGRVEFEMRPFLWVKNSQSWHCFWAPLLARRSQ
ncbi:hypothetical protein YD25_003904 [Salmonella enterica subsp. enterica]|nr:hypothetical protein [Salmonella enterica subsp. enterica serovar Pomona]EDU8805015.1 hypothetical protein [Salmonella enterica subsp. enterica]